MLLKNILDIFSIFCKIVIILTISKNLFILIYSQKRLQLSRIDVEFLTLPTKNS